MLGFQRAIAAALKTVRQVAGADVVYRRKVGDVEHRTELRAGIGRTELKQTTAESLELRKTWRDFLVAVPELVINDQATEPKRGDLIDVVCTGETFQVVNIPGGPCFEVEPRGEGFRIHTKKLGDT